MPPAAPHPTLRARTEATAALVESLGADVAWGVVLAAVAGERVGHGEHTVDADALAPWREPDAVEQLGAVYESLLPERKGSGAFYTPAALAAWLADRAIEELPAAGTVLDPACGTGNVLVEVARRLVAREGPAALARVHGTDLDPLAVDIARIRLRALAPGVAPGVVAARVRVADGLGEHPAAPFDAVVGNPPFLGQLRLRTAGTRAAPGVRLGAYTDSSAAFLHRSLALVRPGGVVALVQPHSVLAARDAARVREAVRAAGAVTGFWAAATPVFPGAGVTTCAPVVRVGRVQGAVATWRGAALRPGPDVALPETEWGPLLAPVLGVPPVRLQAGRGVLGDLGPVTADFRDHYYGLVGAVHERTELADGVPLVTAGLLDAARCRWGRAPARFARRRYDAPVVDPAVLHAGPLAGWAADRLVPKVLLGPQGLVLEAAVDVGGAWLASVPVVALRPAPDRLWHALAVLLAPPVVAAAAARYAGAAMTSSRLRLSARQVAALPLPADVGTWDDGARLARLAQEASENGRPAALRAVGERMCAAYDCRAALEWWVERVTR